MILLAYKDSDYTIVITRGDPKHVNFVAESYLCIASFQASTQILSHSRGEKSAAR